MKQVQDYYNCEIITMIMLQLFILKMLYIFCKSIIFTLIYPKKQTWKHNMGQHRKKQFPFQVHMNIVRGKNCSISNIPLFSLSLLSISCIMRRIQGRLKCGFHSVYGTLYIFCLVCFQSKTVFLYFQNSELLLPCFLV